MNFYWEPNPIILNYLERLCIEKNYKQIIELGPGQTPFKLANTYIDIHKWSDTIETICMDIDTDTYTSNYDFSYARHIFEDIQNPDFAFHQLTSHCKTGYIETPSPIIELCKGVEKLPNGDSTKYRGYVHHRYFVWTDIHTNTLHFLPKLPIVEHFVFSEAFEKQLNEDRNNPILWNNYYLWNDQYKPSIKMHKFTGMFNENEYIYFIEEAIKKLKENSLCFERILLQN
jgi:hypothetical protein